MTDMTEVERFEPYTDEGNREGYGQMEPCEGGDWVRATDYDALAAKLAEVEADVREQRDLRNHQCKLKLEAMARADAAEAKLAKVEEDRDDALIALASARKQLELYIKEAEAALPAAYRLGLVDAFYESGADTPTTVELMARIQTGEKE